MTFHGPGQLIGYPLIDLSRYTPAMGARDYVSRIEKVLQTHLLKSHAIRHSHSKHPGVFLSPTNKIGSIGVQIRHMLTAHGFALNITKEPLPWFDHIISCGLNGVEAVSVESELKKPVNIHKEIPGIIEAFGDFFGRSMEQLDLKTGGEIPEAVLALENHATQAGDWSKAPKTLAGSPAA